MDRVGAVASEVFTHFLSLPILTQWSVTILIVAGLIVHIFAYNEHTAHDGPSIFTTAGIFFTFVGIAEGLFGFNSLDIEKSVPTLLGGLKTAFIASVFGVGIALTLKLRVALFGLPHSGDSEKVYGATIDDLAHQLFAIRNALSGQDESTLVSQLKLTRQDTNDRLDSLKRSQNEFMEKMAENNSKALIEALKDVIRDFNTKITEQFGENFKQLNIAVGQLLEWQQNYRTQLTELIEQEKTTAENMRQSTDRYTDIVSKTEAFSDTAERLGSILEGLETQRTQITESLMSLGEVLTKASDGLPQIENKVMELTEQLTNGVQKNLVSMKEAIESSTSTVEQTMIEAKRLLVDTVSTANKDLNAHVKQLSEKATEQIKKLDVALEKEIAHSITTLASQLTALSKQFVDDYGPLTSNLRDIVRSARNRG